MVFGLVSGCFRAHFRQLSLCQLSLSLFFTVARVARPIGRALSSCFDVLFVSSAEAINAATDSMSSTATITLQQLVRWLLKIPQQLREKDATEACVTIDDGLDKLDFPCSWQCVIAQ